MNPSHETGVHIAGSEGQDIAHEFRMNGGEIGRGVGKIAGKIAGKIPGKLVAEPRPYFVGNGLPDRTLADVFDVIDHVVEHAVRLGAKGRPVGRVERLARIRRIIRASVLVMHSYLFIG